MKCKKCKKLIPDGSKFCNHCGSPTSQKKLYRRKDGLYEKIIKIDGKRVAFRAQKEADVYKKISEYEAKKEAGPLFTEVADEWHTEHWESLSPTTQQGYQFPFDEITEYFSGEHIKDISHKDINRYIKQLPATYARKTCSNRLNILNMIFKYAVIEEYVDDNPCTYISIPKTHGSKKRRAPTSNEMKIINKSIGVEFKSFPVGFLAVFLLYTGCRKGEALALQFKDIEAEVKRKFDKTVEFTRFAPAEQYNQKIALALKQCNLPSPVKTSLPIHRVASLHIVSTRLYYLSLKHSFLCFLPLPPVKNKTACTIASGYFSIIILSYVWNTFHDINRHFQAFFVKSLDMASRIMKLIGNFFMG